MYILPLQRYVTYYFFLPRKSLRQKKTNNNLALTIACVFCEHAYWETLSDVRFDDVFGNSPAIL